MRILFFYFLLFITSVAMAQTPADASKTKQPPSEQDSDIRPLQISPAQPIPISTFSEPNEEILKEKEKINKEEQTTLDRIQINLEQEQRNFKEKINSLENIPTDEKMLQQATVERETRDNELKSIQLKQQGIETSLREKADELNQQRKRLESLKLNATPIEQLSKLENTIGLQTQLVEIEQRQLDLVKKQSELARQRLDLAISWKIAVQNSYQIQQKQDLESSMRQQQQTFLAEATNLRKQLEAMQGSEKTAQYYLLETQIQEKEESAQKTVNALKIEHLKKQFKQLEIEINQKSIPVSREMVQKIKDISLGIREMQSLLSTKVGLLKQQEWIVEQRLETSIDSERKFINQSKKILVGLRADIEEQQSTLPPLLSENIDVLLKKSEEAYKEELRKMLLKRRELPEEWQIVLRDFEAVPAIFLGQLSNTTTNFIQIFQQITKERWITIIFSVFIWTGFFLWVRHLLVGIFHKLENTKQPSFSANSLMIGLRLLHMNAVGIFVTGSFLLLVWLAQPTVSSVLLTVTLLFIWLGIKFPIDLSRLILLEQPIEATVAQHKLFFQLRWVFILTGLLTAITVLGHLIPIANTVRDLIDTFFMVFLSLTVFPVMRIRSMFMTFLEGKISQSYWLLVIRLISLLFPLSILAVALLGVVGYINLGWNVAKHLSLFLVVLAGWLSARGLLNDIINFIKNFAIKHSNYGLLWTQDIIPLFDKLLGISLIIIAIMTFFWLNGWYADVAVMDSIKQFFTFPLANVGASAITVGDILLSGFALWGVFWFGGWVRQITYRWIFLGINDLGVRHSLSVFTQYTVILIGLLITLRVIGIDLTTLAVFAGALGVGIGFGLQNVANNFISGILLLIERPLRAGDIVNIGGTFEGEVKEIGIRSLTIRSWDYQEIIVPNSEIISKSFVNWTRSDSLCRMTVYIRVAYGIDLHKVNKVLKEILKEFPDIVRDPPPKIFLWEFTPNSIDFRLDYFINMQKTGRFRSKSSLLLKIWENFEKEGIQLAYMPQARAIAERVEENEEEKSRLILLPDDDRHSD